MANVLIFSISACLLLSAVQCEISSLSSNNSSTVPKCLEISTFDENTGNITSPNYPQPYPTGCSWEWTVNATGQTQLLVTFQSLDINTPAGDQLSIQIFEDEKDVGSKLVVEDNKEIEISWNVGEGQRMIEFLFNAVERNETNNHTGFSLQYTVTSNTNNQVANNEEKEATEIKNFTIPENAKDVLPINYGFIIINLQGKTKDQFTEEKDKFCIYLADLATVYCKAHNISKANLSKSSVVVNSIVPCSSDWPESSFCISVNFSIPVPNTSSELNAPHLYAIWLTHSIDYLWTELGVKEYAMEENNLVLVLWLATTGTLFLLFLAILAVVLRTRVVENYIKRTRREHLTGYGVYERSRFAQPTQQQLVPPFFYPDERVIIEHKNFNHYGTQPLHKNGIIGQENPAFVPDSVGKKVISQNSQEAIDDFDSDDDTVYPPSPLARQSSNRPQPTISRRSSQELETAF